MQFVGLKPLRPQLPTIEIESSLGSLDLHNDAVLREITYDFSGRVLRLAWTIKQPAWTVPHAPEPEDRPTWSSAVLVLSGVRALVFEGYLAIDSDNEAGTLDHFEYHHITPGLGEVRFVFTHDAEITVKASRCELLLYQSLRAEG